MSGARQFDAVAFRITLDERKIANVRVMVNAARTCIEHGAVTPNLVDRVFAHLTRQTRARYRSAVRRYVEVVGRAA